MAKEETTPPDFDQAEIIAHLVLKIDEMDPAYVDKISDEIYKFQPFYLSTLLGFSYDVSEEELAELMKIYFLVWECFRAQPKIKKKQVKEKPFTAVFEKIALSLENASKTGFSTSAPPQDFQKLKSKDLLATVMHLFNHKNALKHMETEINMMALLGLISFIDCFENL